MVETAFEKAQRVERVKIQLAGYYREWETVNPICRRGKLDALPKQKTVKEADRDLLEKGELILWCLEGGGSEQPRHFKYIFKQD